MNLEGKTALITGSARRIGREIALTLAHSGADVVVHYRNSSREALSLKGQIESLGRKAYLVRAELSSQSSVKKFAAEVFRKTDSVDLLINNASIFYATPFPRIQEKDWDAFMDSNLKAPFFLSQIFGEKMAKRRSGKIINLVDWMGERPSVNYLPYCISKAGLIAATKGLAKVLAPYVQVAGIAPGPILPAEWRGSPKGRPAEKATPKEQKKAAERSLLKRYGNPKDIAQAVKFLVSSDFVTGSILYVEGGASLA